jgi:NTE family protein
MSGRRAVVLGGGGVTGIAWLTGVLAALARDGVALSDADCFVGTSAGSVVAAQLATGCDLEQLYRRQLEPPSSEIAARLSARDTLALVGTMVARDGQAARAGLGRRALVAPTVPEEQRIAVIESRLPIHEWPERQLLVTAVDALTGELVVFDRSQGVDLVRAVAASCAVPLVWPPVTIDGRRYIDGGVRSPVNADLARGFDQVVVLAPITAAVRRADRVQAQLRAGSPSARHLVLSPDRTARKAFGRNSLDPARRAAAAREGRRQGAALVEVVRQGWMPVSP